MLITIYLHVIPSHTEVLVSGTAHSEGVESTPEMVSYYLWIALCAVNKNVVHEYCTLACM